MKTLAYELLNNSLGDLLWETELEVKDVDMFFKDKGFWTDVTKAWCEFRMSQKRTVCFDQQVIWLNSKIRDNHGPLVWNNWIKKGIFRIVQIKNGADYLNLNEFREHFQGLPFMEFYSLKAIINQIDDVDMCGDMEVNCLSFYRDMEKPFGIMYRNWNLNEHILLQHYHCFRVAWQILDKEPSFDDYVTCITKIKLLTISSKLNSFQFKLMLSAILTNYVAFVMNHLNGMFICFGSVNMFKIFGYGYLRS